MKDKISLDRAACLLFVPGHRPDRFAKALAASPDGIIIDLEDAVASRDRPAARLAIAAFFAARGTESTPPVAVRINALGTRDGLDDLIALADGKLDPDILQLAKVEHPRDIELVRRHDRKAAERLRPIIALIETARGLEQAVAIAEALGPADALAFGGADLAADLGAALEWEPMLPARARVVCAAAIRGLAVFDVPHLTIGAIAELTHETMRARAMGFTGKIAIHPSQVGPIRGAFAPSPAEVERAQRIVAAASAGGVGVVDGKMVDPPVVAAARRILARAEPAPQR
jgi:(S)-citramalyl-CoA lyase